MGLEPADRRRSPRVAVPERFQGTLRLTIPVRVIDVSSEGLQLELAVSLQNGASYDFQASLDDQVFEALIRIVRCRAARYVDDGAGHHYIVFRAGAQFASVPDRSRQALEGWIRSWEPGDPGAALLLAH